MAKKKTTNAATKPDPKAVKQQVEQLGDLLITNAMMSRAQLARKFLDPRRSLDDECGLPSTTDVKVQDYRDLYDRVAIAARVVGVLSSESWMVQPTVFETEDVDNVTPFEDAWQTLDLSPQGSSWYKTEEGHPIWDYLRRGDELSGIGHYGILLLGIDDGKPLSEAAEGIDATGKAVGAMDTQHKLTFIRPFDESLAPIAEWETDTNNPRYGQPTAYNVSFADPRTMITAGAVDVQRVHWSRVVHLADNRGSSEVIGVPRLLPVLDNVMGLKKMYCVSPEMYYRGAFPGISFETHPSLGGDVKIDTATMQGQIETYMNSLQRYFVTKGFEAKSLQTQVVDPTPQINVQLDAICILIGCPKRIFVGSERGELASGQDDDTWNDRLGYRQNYYLTPCVIVPLVDRLIALRVLPTPKDGYEVAWPDLGSLSAEAKATIALQRTEAMAKYIQGGGAALMGELDFLTRILDMPVDEAKEALKNAMPIEDLMPMPNQEPEIKTETSPVKKKKE